MVDDSLIEEIRTHSPADNRALTERYNEEQTSSKDIGILNSEEIKKSVYKLITMTHKELCKQPDKETILIF